jgi:hypothetical protein
MMISVGDVPSINTAPNSTDWATGALRVRPPRPMMRGSSLASRNRRFNSWSSSRSSGTMQVPQEMPPKRKCESPGPDSSSTPTFFLAPRPEARTRSKTAAYSSEKLFPDSPLAARMFDSWQYLSEDEEEEMVIDRCSAPSLVLDPADSMEFAPALPLAVIEPIDWTHSMMGVVDALVMDDDDDDDDNTSSVVSWDFWPRRSSLPSRDGSDFDDTYVEGDDDGHGRDLLNVDRFMSSLLLSDDSDNDDVDDEDEE